MADDQVTLVKSANDIVDVVGEYVQLRKNGRTYKGLCPFHDDHNPSFDVDPSRQRFRCWSCGKFGDVLTFVQEREKVEFREALEILARRAHITLRRGPAAAELQGRATMLDLMNWAAEQYHQCLRTMAMAEPALNYLGDRSLSQTTIDKYQLGYAPNAWEWLTQRALKAGWSRELLVTVGLAAPRERDSTLYDRFRDRVIFPIRDVRGRTVGFGGRVIPDTETAQRGPKYYNSSDTPLFTKSEHLYGLDQARDAGEREKFLAVVEGYTDVLMAHQHGVKNVVATLGTALNLRHITQLRRFVPRVVLVFDADAGGEDGVDRALELFVSEEVDLAIATLPDGQDPCDLLVQRGPDAFKAALAGAIDALDFKLNRVMAAEGAQSLEGRRRAIDSVLLILAGAPKLAGQGGQVKRELMVNRIAQRFGVREETIWKRLRELQASVTAKPREFEAVVVEERSAPADRCERELLEVLLAEPSLTGLARERVSADSVAHPGLHRLLQVMYDLHGDGRTPEADLVRDQVSENSALADYVVRLQAAGERPVNRRAWLDQLVTEFEKRARATDVRFLKDRLKSVPNDGPPPLELLRMLQEKSDAPRAVATTPTNVTHESVAVENEIEELPGYTGEEGQAGVAQKDEFG